MTKDARARLRELAEKATPGPWKVHRYEHANGQQWLSVLSGAWDITHNKNPGDIASAKYSAMTDEENLANANLIAATSPQTILALLDDLDRMEKFIESHNWVKPGRDKGEETDVG